MEKEEIVINPESHKKRFRIELFISFLIVILIMGIILVLIFSIKSIIIAKKNQTVMPDINESQNITPVNPSINDTGIITQFKPNCSDGKKNGDETGIDCGGSCKRCTSNRIGGEEPNPPCNPNCIGKQCGTDSCGGICGQCNSNKTCNSNGECVNSGICTPNCAGKVCGSDSCGGKCSPGCSAGYYCNSNGGCEKRVIKLTNNISQYGITWYFDKEYEYGQFVNGDYWVVGPVNIIKITPESHFTSNGEKNSEGISYPNSTKVIGNWTIKISSTWWDYTRAIVTVENPEVVFAGKFVYVSGTGNSNVNRKIFYVDKIESNVVTLRLIKGMSYTWGNISGGRLGGAEIHGSMINPSSTSGLQGYVMADGTYYLWEPHLNVAYGINSSNKLIVPVGSSLISTESRMYTKDYQTYVNKAAVLTVISDVPPQGSFRPSYFGNDKTIKFNANNLNYSFLGKLSPISGNTPVSPNPASLTSMENQLLKPWVRSANYWTSRGIHPKENMHDYYFYDTLHGALTLLNLNYTDEQKKNVYIHFVQKGIDWFGPFEDGFKGHPPDGGIFNGYLIITITAGHALNYRPMIDIFQKSGDYLFSAKPGGGNYGYYDLPPDYIHFHELGQTFYVSELNINVTNNLAVWKPNGQQLNDPDLLANGGPGLSYTTNDTGLPDYGIRNSVNPEFTTKSYYTWKDYRSLNSDRYVQMAFLLLIMDMRKDVNHNAFFDYADRWYNTTGGIYASKDFYNYYRKNYGCTWTRDNSSDRYSKGHYVCDKEKYKCTWQISTCSSCVLADSCNKYTSPRACDYDPCNLGCNGNCGISGSVATRAPENVKQEKIGLISWIMQFFS